MGTCSPSRCPRPERHPDQPTHPLPIPRRPGPPHATPRCVEEQITKAEQAVAGKAPVKRNRFLTITGATKKVNRDLET